MRRAWSTLTIKSVDEEQRVITGIATSASTDRSGDVVEPAGAEFDLPLPLLWQHDSKSPIGQVTAAKTTKAGIEITAQFAQTDRPGALKQRLDDAWESVKLGLVRGLSIGFKELKSEPIDPKDPWGAVHYLKWLWLELSAVTIPANADASIQTIKSLDLGLAASGAPPASPRNPSGVSDRPRVVKMRTDTTMKKSYADQIASWEATRAAKAARLDEILTKSSEAGATLDAAEAEEHDTIDGEIKGIDAQLVRLRSAEAREKAAATEVSQETRGGVAVRQGARITVERKLPPGIAFARYAMCVGASKGFPGEAQRLAQKYYPDDPGISALIEKSGVAAGSTTGSHWLDDMVPYNVMNDFIEYLRPGSIIGKFGTNGIPSLNRVGFNERVSGASSGLTAAWVGEGLPAIPSVMVTYNATIPYTKLRALAILTKEGIRFSNPAAEARVRDEIAKAVNGKMDLDFVDPAKAVSAGVSPASITNGIVATTPTGTTAAYFRTNLATMLKLFATNNLGMGGLVLIMSETMAIELSMMVNTLGNEDFPGLTAKGGTLRGIPVITSEHLTSVGSPSTQMIVAVKAGDVYLADDGVVTVEASDQASLEMQDSSAQSGISGTGASLVSLWQNGLVGLLAAREITWKLRRATAVQYISPAAYSA